MGLGALVGSSLVDMCAKCGNLGGCLEILQQDGISRCGHLEHHDWHMSNGSPDDENASTPPHLHKEAASFNMPPHLHK